jgi:hypothetical protein
MIKCSTGSRLGDGDIDGIDGAINIDEEVRATCSSISRLQSDDSVGIETLEKSGESISDRVVSLCRQGLVRRARGWVERILNEVVMPFRAHAG